MFKRQKGQNCLNCGTNVEGANFCSECGQPNDTRRLTFLELIGESLSNFFAIDGRVFRTISGVILRPGGVAIDFREGKRMRYMNPVRFYFLSSVLLISSIQFSRNTNIVENSTNIEEMSEIQNMDAMEQSEMLYDLAYEFKHDESPGFLKRFRTMTNYLIISPESSQEEVFLQLEIEAGFWNEFAYAQAVKASKFGTNSQDNFKAFNRALISQLFWILFLFIPILGLILKLLYVRRDMYYPEHLFFTLYQQGLFFFLTFFYNIFFESQILIQIIVGLFGLHLLIAMKNFYGQKWGKTIFKFLLINLFGIISFAAFFMLALVMVFILI